MLSRKLGEKASILSQVLKKARGIEIPLIDRLIDLGGGGSRRTSQKEAMVWICYSPNTGFSFLKSWPSHDITRPPPVTSQAVS